MKTNGIIFNIQRFSTHDGPGIRSTVFLKGCPLSCLWCANPESQSFNPQLMTRNIKCTGCGACISMCSQNVITITHDGGRHINWKACNNCFECVSACLYGALTVVGETTSPQDIVDEVSKDDIFYKNSGGGITLSGGDPLAQHTFLLELLKLIKLRGYHVALDTTGHAPSSVIDIILPYIDLVLFDIKHLDPLIHKRVTGVDNSIILKNVRHVTQRTRTWFRIPLIEGLNDSHNHITDIADMAAELGVEKISLLPFHEGGFVKWEQTGQVRPVFSGETPNDEHINELCNIIKQKGISVSIRC